MVRRGKTHGRGKGEYELRDTEGGPGKKRRGGWNKGRKTGDK